jgi:hypothetical protein
MKKSYMTWNKENVDDEVILQHLKELSKGKLSLDSEKVQNEKLLDIQIKDFKPMASKPVFESMSSAGSRPSQNKDFRKTNLNNRGGNGNNNSSRSFKKRSN